MNTAIVMTSAIPADRPPTYECADAPAFHYEITKQGDWFTLRTWQTARSSVQGQEWRGYQLQCSAQWRITKRGELGRFVGSEHYSGDISRAHQAWIRAGKPQEFYYCEQW